MIEFEKFTLKNGLKVILNRDTETPIASVNLLYNVGARFENPEKTGFAHLFEHLMFGGSVNIPEYDTPLQMVGGENNAFTNNDFTNYYLTLPVKSIENAFWLESDRMLSLAFSEKSLDVQKNVVIEEFKQRYLNQPYGDVWLLLRPLVYKHHPYKWATIGKDISHIESANIDDVKDFFYRYYAPDNCSLTVSGNFNYSTILALIEKWFGLIENRNVVHPSITKEPKQEEARFLEVERDVPQNAIYKAWHMCDRLNKDYHTTDLISDLLSNGKSARLFQSLVKEQKMFSDVNAYISGDIDPGMFIITGNPLPNVKMKDAEIAINREIERICSGDFSDYEVEKVKNKFESAHKFANINSLNRAMNLAYFDLLGDPALINSEVSSYREVSRRNIIETANNMFDPLNCTTLYYMSSNS